MRISFRLALLLLICIAPAHAEPKPPLDQPTFRVVLDPGHGGANLGAPCGPEAHCHEKQLTLPIALMAERRLRAAGVEVYMTRRLDQDVGISKRVQFANQLAADLLVSIHLNSSDTVGPSGYMTFILSEGGITEAESRLVQFESLAPVSLNRSASQRYRSSDLDDILFDLTVSHAQRESAHLAAAIQNALGKASPFTNKGIRQAPFHVLMGTAMPAVVCELGFLNHPVEGKFLRSIDGQRRLANAIADGILAYSKRLITQKAGK